ncbi:hypothetical protein [Gordonia sp. (in: high G+C Gram-positive bacteria)]|uniref:hypothetical protein n=1 Tax=Gordonia sp. (in: high G+C Gram-positive bacteria) TaxID=84139 RepID=UPI00261359BE|nr:hypothetical protein [Gordonia sp. (in: high G+C Gram-positive bacteria)]
MTKLNNYIERIRRMDLSIGDIKRELREFRDETARSLDHTETAAAIAARRASLRRAAARVVVLVHNPTVWSSLDELVRLMDDAPDFEPIVVSIPHHYSGLGPNHGEAEVHDVLEAAGVEHVRLPDAAIGSATALLRALDPDIVIRQSQWDQDVDDAFSTDALAWARTILVPYGTLNVIQNVPWGDPPVNSAVDTAWHRACWLVFVANETVLRIARRDSLTGGRQFRALGHPKADAVREVEPVWPVPERDGARRPRVAWSAHHSILSGWNDFGVFPEMREGMLEWAADTPDVEFAFFHHPLLIDTIERPKSPVSPAEFQDWLARWNALPNTAYWTGLYASAAAAADVVVTDGPSMLSESQILGKPVLFVERPGHVPFNEIGEILAEGVHLVSSAQEARARFGDILDDDPLAEVQRRNVRQLFGEPGAAGRILDEIRAQIAVERGEA